MNKKGKLYCPWAHKGLALHNSGAALVCCHSRSFLKDENDEKIFFSTHSLEDAWNSPTRKEIQTSLDQGEQHENCAACWGEENAGHHSRRLGTLYQIQEIEDQGNIALDSESKNLPLLLDLKLGNVCNLSCRTCNPYVSSKWVKDWWKVFESKNNNEFDNYKDYSDVIFRSSRESYNDNNNKLWDTLDEWIPSIAYIDVYGGEPFLTHKLFEILQKNMHPDTALEHIQYLHINTNATVWNQDYIDIATKTHLTQFDLSIDGLYDHFDYIRNGETWSTVEENIEKFLNLRTSVNPGGFWPENNIVFVSVVITVSYLNVYYLESIYKYFKDRGVHMHFNLAHTPLHVSVKALPDPVKKIVTDKLSSSTDGDFVSAIQPVINYLNQDFVHDTFAKNYEQSVWKEMIRITNELDEIRNQDFKTTFPEFWEVVKPYWN